MAGLVLKNVAKLYPNGGVGVKDFSLEIQDGEFAVLVGPAGSGKSTLLRMIGGLEDISLGDVYIDGERVNDLEPRERNVAMIFRNYMLYPQMTVYENLAFGLKLTGCGKSEIHERVLETARLLEIEGLLELPSEQVTGIDRYKVVVGRALARRPRVLLMDDPMIRLDGQLRQEMREGLADLHHRLGVTVVYVTEDASEAMLIGTRLAVIRDGVLEQTGTPEEICRKPQNRFVAEYFSNPPMNVMTARVEEENGRAILWVDDRRGVFSPENSRRLLEGGYAGKEITIAIRPGDIHAEKEWAEKEADNCLQASADSYEEDESGAYMTFSIDGESVRARVPESAGIRPGDTVTLAVDSAKVYIFDKDTQKAI
ncbi:MAG TPA: ABC transporter ATP-binding protein [Candidatus Lachnoclostridium pullistercoris]|uniref:ABC transporter ATP-binding protein n=1 Tax=Candidatus Lachnoclostridium pullistercoris TaxID=2838632 RepID=A0A9D2P9E4_9FIRM|nr:ABC transporter ATP-binding protein [Candidatus Lachnoclostridium pullistercoris]